jgi:hypothetical protein
MFDRQSDDRCEIVAQERFATRNIEEVDGPDAAEDAFDFRQREFFGSLIRVFSIQGPYLACETL